ncbi:hypothetical protein [Actibacterium lipolyticum]|uniref:hypothetical protein n=1 Tax=Actibacterium lipolyticum TaxID=1524263 RepID=UPI0011326126|nr:hypothetical protein [Actibacterium lipolyticum]
MNADLPTGIAAGVIVLSAAAGLLSPHVQAGIEAGFGVHMASAAFVSVPMLGYYWFSGQSAKLETEIDFVRNQLRLFVRTRRGSVNSERTLPFYEIRSTFIKRAEKPGGAAGLFVRVMDSEEVIQVACGREDNLRALHDRLVDEFRPSVVKMDGWERVGRRLRRVAA